MFSLARREAGIFRECLRDGKSLSSVRASRVADEAGVRADAEGLGTTIEDARRARSRGPGIIRIETRMGPVHLRPRDTDLLVLRQILINREYELEKLPQLTRIQARYREILAGGHVPVIVDAGANIGAASMWFAKLFPEAAFAMVEPDPANAQVARLNASLLSNAHVFEAALGATNGKVKLDIFEDQGWGSRTSRAEDGVSIVTIPELIDSVPNGRAFIVKIDIEGFESDVFSSNLDWIDEPAAIFIEPHDWMLPGAGTSQGFQKALLGKGREILVVGENLVFV